LSLVNVVSIALLKAASSSNRADRLATWLSLVDLRFY